MRIAFYVGLILSACFLSRVCNAQAVTTKDTPVTISFSNHSVLYVVTTLPTHGILKDLNSNKDILAIPYMLQCTYNVLYTPYSGYVGTDQFKFKTFDGTTLDKGSVFSLRIDPPVTTQPSNPIPSLTSISPSNVVAGSGSFILTVNGANFLVNSSVAWNDANRTTTFVNSSQLTAAISATDVANIGSANITVYNPSPGGGKSNVQQFTITAPTSQPSTQPSPGLAIGIPGPVFGYQEVSPALPTNWTSTVNGFYYIDNTIAAATDSSNANGYPAKPRKTIPEGLPAGAVVEVHGGPYTYTVGGVLRMNGTGNSNQPIFIKGTGSPMFSKPLEIGGSYLIIDGINLNAWSTSNDAGITFKDGTNHVCIRNSEVQHGPNATTSAIAIGGSSATGTNSYITIYNNKVHDNGDWHATYDQDHHGIGIFEYSDHIFVLNNTMYHNSGDGLQINSGNLSQMQTTHHIFVGKNIAYENKQSGFWCKTAVDVVFSQNISHTHRPSDSSTGQGMGWQYGPERVWFIYNEIYDCEYGINSGSVSGPGGDGTGTNIYIIGNLIHNIHNTGTTQTGAWIDGAAIAVRDETSLKHVINNTIYDCDLGITNPRAAGIRMVNNILTNIPNEHIFIEQSTTATKCSLSNSLFDNPSRIKWGTSTSMDLTTFKVNFPSQGTGCIKGSADFVNAAGGDFHLANSSIGLNSGISDAVYGTYQTAYGVSIAITTDGTVRPQGNWDMGCFEK